MSGHCNWTQYRFVIVAGTFRSDCNLIEIRQVPAFGVLRNHMSLYLNHAGRGERLCPFILAQRTNSPRQLKRIALTARKPRLSANTLKESLRNETKILMYANNNGWIYDVVISWGREQSKAKVIG